jgi:hypothetical protein
MIGIGMVTPRFEDWGEVICRQVRYLTQYDERLA